MSTMIEAFLVAALAGMVAGVSVGWMNRKILKFKKHKKYLRLNALDGLELVRPTLMLM